MSVIMEAIKSAFRAVWDHLKMSRATTIQHKSGGKTTARRKTIMIAGAAVVALLVLSYISMASVFPAGIKVSPADGSQDVSLDQQISVSTSWMRGHINSVSVKQSSLNPSGASVGDKTINGHLGGGIFVTDNGPLKLEQDSKYAVTVDADLTEFSLTGPHHREVTQTFTFQTITTPAPIFSQDTQIVPMGQPITVDFNTPIQSFNYQLSPNVQSSSSIDSSNPTRAYITLANYQQGQKFDLTITAATGKDGVQMSQPYTQKISTTEPLKVKFVPGDGEAGASVYEEPTLTFTENIKNQGDADKLLSIDPATPGSWDWAAPNKVAFKPARNWSNGEKVTIHLKGGQDAFRGDSGSFLREDVSSTFTVIPEKVIEVNLSQQRVYAYDNNHLVRTLICSSGSQATPSLTGTYAVYAKSPAVDMSGPGYHAPHVPWVLMFNGDYTIHGNYWATRFGVPTSHGCVGLPVPDAQWLYSWTPLGTIIKIHY